MTLALGNVIASIGGDGGGGVTPHRYVHDFGPTPIPAGGAILHKVPDVPEVATMVATLEWDGPGTGELAVIMEHGGDSAVGVAFDMGTGLLPATVVSNVDDRDDPENSERGVVSIQAVAEGYTAIRLTAIIIPTINEAT